MCLITYSDGAAVLLDWTLCNATGRERAIQVRQPSCSGKPRDSSSPSWPPISVLPSPLLPSPPFPSPCYKSGVAVLCWQAIDSMKPQRSTNLMAGIVTGFDKVCILIFRRSCTSPLLHFASRLGNLTVNEFVSDDKSSSGHDPVGVFSQSNHHHGWHAVCAVASSEGA